MRFLSDQALERLRDTASAPNLEGTRYTMLGKAARGGMGVVYAAQDEKLDRRVALKVLDAPGPSDALARRLVREAQILARLEHPGIVPVHDVGTLHDGRVFYTMKFVEGQRLDEHIRAVPSVPDRLRLFLRICDAVAFAHARGVLHRDLKPANVMIGPFGEVLVLDWGLARILRKSVAANSEGHPERTTAKSSATSTNGYGSKEPSVVTSQGTVVGTPGYMSPEQERGDNDRLDARSDIFSLGAVLRFLLNDTSPGISPPDSPIDKSIQAVCAKALAADPARRYGRVTLLAADVSRYLDGLPVTARQETFFDQTVRFYRRHRVAILLIAAYLLMRVILLFAYRR